MEGLVKEIDELLYKYKITINDAIKIYYEHKTKVNKTKKRFTQYHADKDEEWIYTVKDTDTLCDCGGKHYHKEYDAKENRIYCICNKCNAIVYSINDKFIAEHLSQGIWK